MPRYTYSFLGLVQQLTNWLLPLLASLKVICSHKVPVLFFFRTLPSLTPLTLHFFGARRLRFLLVLYGQLFGAWKPDELTFSPPSQAFKTSLRGCLCLRERYKSYVRALLVFQVTRGILVSLSLFSLHFLFRKTDHLQDRGLLPFDLPPSTTNSCLTQ